MITIPVLLLTALLSLAFLIHVLMKRLETLEELLVANAMVVRVLSKQLIEQERNTTNSKLSDEELFDLIAKKLGL